MTSPSAQHLFEAETNREAFEVKLKRFLGAQDEAHRRRMDKLRTIAMVFLLATAGSGYLFYKNIRSDDEAVVLFIVTLILGIVSLVFFFKSRARHDELDRARDIEGMYRALRDDLHPRTRITSRLDLSEVTEGTPERQANSPYSGAVKRWYRHAWLDFGWAFADGNLLRLELIDLVKTKSGAEIRREHQVKGHLKVNGRVYRAVGPSEELQLRTATKPLKDGFMVYFWGTVETHDDLLNELKLLYGALDPHGVRQAPV